MKGCGPSPRGSDIPLAAGALELQNYLPWERSKTRAFVQQASARARFLQRHETCTPADSAAVGTFRN